MEELREQNRGIDKKQDYMMGEMKKMQSVLNATKDATVNNKRQIDWVTDRVQKVEGVVHEVQGVVHEVQTDLEKVEMERIRGHVKFFNIKEPSSEGTREDCKGTIIRLLEKHYPECDWEERQLEGAFRLGRAEVSRGARPILAKFRDTEAARTVLGLREGRDSLAKEGVRVAKAHTQKQTAILRDLRQQGKNAYVYRGQIKIRPGDPRMHRQGYSQPSVRPKSAHKPPLSFPPSGAPSDLYSQTTLQNQNKHGSHKNNTDRGTHFEPRVLVDDRASERERGVEGGARDLQQPARMHGPSPPPQKKLQRETVSEREEEQRSCPRGGATVLHQSVKTRNTGL